MHEIGLATSIVEQAQQAARKHGAGRIRSVRCRIGALRQIDDELLRAAFSAASADSACASASLEILRVPMRACCTGCRHEFPVVNWDWTCPACELPNATLSGGDELELVSLEAEALP